MKVAKKRSFSFTRINKLPVKDSQYDISVPGEPGLFLRIYPSGQKSFRYGYRLTGQTRLHWLTLGRYPVVDLDDAKLKAIEYRKLLATGVDPKQWLVDQQQSKQQEVNWTDLVDLYIERYARPNKKSWKLDKRVLAKFTQWKKRQAQSISKTDISDAIWSLSKGKSYRNRVYQIVRKVFSWATSEGRIPNNPCLGLPNKPGGVEVPRERVLDEHEIKAVWTALGEDSSYTDAVSMLKLVLVTLCRPGEIRFMRVQDLDLDNRLWTIPGEFTKTSQPHTVHLSYLEAVAKVSQRQKLSEIYGGGRQLLWR